MKKAFALILTLILTLGCVSALAAEPKDLVGSWYCVKRADYDNQIRIPLNEIRLDINRDKSIVISFGDVEYQGTWKATDEGVELTYEKEEGNTRYLDLTLDDGMLLSGDNSLLFPDDTRYSVDFAREQADIQLPQEVEVTQEDEYFGTYVIDGAVIGNDYVKAEGGADLVKLVIDFAQVTASGSDLKSDEEIVAVTDFQDGKLSLGAQGILVGSYDEGTLILSKLDNGGVVAHLDAEGASAYYFVPMDEAEPAEAEEAADPEPAEAEEKAE